MAAGSAAPLRGGGGAEKGREGTALGGGAAPPARRGSVSQSVSQSERDGGGAARQLLWGFGTRSSSNPGPLTYCASP